MHPKKVHSMQAGEKLTEVTKSPLTTSKQECY